MKKFTIYFLTIIFVFPAFLFAQKATITGKIIDKDSKQPLYGANILLNPSAFGAATNQKGEFAISSVKSGDYKLMVSYLGYKKYEKKIQVDGANTVELTIELEKGPIILSPTEIQVPAKAFFTHSKVTILQNQIENEATRDIGDFLRTVPNVAAIRKGGANLDPVVRGFKFDQLNVHMDGGIRIEGGCPNRMDPTSSHVEMEDIDNIEIIKGPYVLRYGPTFGGIVNLVTKKPVPSSDGSFQIHARAVKAYESNWNGDKEHLQVYGGTDKIYFSLAGAQLRYGNYKTGNGDVISSSFHKWNYSAKLAFRPAENQELMFSYIESHGRDVRFPALPMDERSDNTRITSLDYTAKDISEVIKDVKVKVYQTYVDHMMDNKEKPFGDTVAAVSAIDPTVIGGRMEVGLKLGGGHMYIGTDYETIDKSGTRQKSFYAMSPTGMNTMPYYEEILWGNSTSMNNGVFAEYSRKMGTLEIVGAVRFDLNEANSDTIRIYSPNGKQLKYTDGNTSSSFSNVSASLGMKKDLNEKLRLGVGLGRGVRSPNMLERFIVLLPVGYDKYDYLGNPQLKPEANHQADVTLSYMDNDLGGFTLNGFYSYVIDYISAKQIPETVVQKNTSSALGVKQFYNVEDPVTFTGFEFTYVTPAKYKLGGQLIAAYTQGTFGSNYLKLTKIDNDPMNEIPPFELNASVKYKFLNNKFVPQLRLRYVADQNRVSETFEEETTPSFTLLDFNFVYKLNTNINISGGVNNMFDVAYYEHLNRRMLGSSANLYEPGRVFFVNMILNF